MDESRSRGRFSLVLTLSVLLAFGGSALVANAAADGVSAARATENESHTPMTYAASVLASTVYFPAKVVFAGAGAVTSGVAYLVTAGNSQSASSIWNAAVEGDYIVRPDVIEGSRPLHVTGS